MFMRETCLREVNPPPFLQIIGPQEIDFFRIGVLSARFLSRIPFDVGDISRTRLSKEI